MFCNGRRSGVTPDVFKPLTSAALTIIGELRPGGRRDAHRPVLGGLGLLLSHPVLGMPVSDHLNNNLVLGIILVSVLLLVALPNGAPVGYRPLATWVHHPAKRVARSQARAGRRAAARPLAGGGRPGTRKRQTGTGRPPNEKGKVVLDERGGSQATSGGVAGGGPGVELRAPGRRSFAVSIGPNAAAARLQVPHRAAPVQAPGEVVVVRDRHRGGAEPPRVRKPSASDQDASGRVSSTDSTSRNTSGLSVAVVAPSRSPRTKPARGTLDAGSGSARSEASWRPAPHGQRQWELGSMGGSGRPGSCSRRSLHARASTPRGPCTPPAEAHSGRRSTRTATH